MFQHLILNEVLSCWSRKTEIFDILFYLNSPISPPSRFLCTNDSDYLFHLQKRARMLNTFFGIRDFARKGDTIWGTRLSILQGGNGKISLERSDIRDWGPETEKTKKISHLTAFRISTEYAIRDSSDKVRDL